MTIDTVQACPKCNTPFRVRPLAKQPLFLTLLFAVSFILMLTVTHFEKLPSKVLWLWSAGQFLVGGLVIRGRIRAKKKVFHCARCDSPLR